MFRDLITAKFVAGKGGDGHVSFGADKKPSGGIGGNGGNVYLEGSINTYDLGFINRDSVFKAENGEPGGRNNLTGKNGDDLIIKVPLTTKVYDEEHNLLFTISKPEQRELLLEGGLGGLGNRFYKKAHGRDLYRFQTGKIGQEVEPTLELELFSHIIFIGLPNAGKSTLLNELTNAEAKIGAYPFTTLLPQQGRMNEITLMDLPGLIEGTAEGKGVGTKFVKHTRSARILAHLISAESDDVTRDYKIIRGEIKNIGDGLDEKKELIILTKVDQVTEEVKNEKIRELKKLNKEVFAASSYDNDSLEKLKKVFTDELKEFSE
ncbi:MAG: GTPase [Candidatus Dojkabacteria bacterium]